MKIFINDPTKLNELENINPSMVESITLDGLSINPVILMNLQNFPPDKIIFNNCKTDSEKIRIFFNKK